MYIIMYIGSSCSHVHIAKRYVKVYRKRLVLLSICDYPYPAGIL